MAAAGEDDDDELNRSMSPAAVEDGKERRSGEHCRRATVEEIVVGSSRLKSR